MLVSPRLPASTVDHTIYDHTSILRAVLERFRVPGELGRRAAAANPVDFVPGEARDDVPDLLAPVASEDGPPGDSPLTAFQAAMACAAAERLRELGAHGTLAQWLPETKLQVEEALQRLAAALPESSAR